jgi:hypothetical protein
LRPPALGLALLVRALQPSQRAPVQLLEPPLAEQAFEVQAQRLAALLVLLSQV